MLKSQVVAIFKRIYSALPHPLRRSFWNVTLLAILTALTEFVLAGLVSLLGVALASPQSIVQAASMQTIVQRIPVLQPVLTDTRLLLALLLGGLCVIVLVKNLLQAFLSWRQSRFSQAVGREFGIRLFTGYLHTTFGIQAEPVLPQGDIGNTFAVLLKDGELGLGDLALTCAGTANLSPE